MSSAELPPCGLYRTVKPFGNVESGRLVYFHNHGNPGAGVYFPEKWHSNRAEFSPNGVPVPEDFDPRSLRALPAEGFYRVAKAFFCCEKKCVQFEPEAFVQLGYNGAGRALLFVPELGGGSITVPERGTMIDDPVLVHLVHLKFPDKTSERPEITMPRGIVVH